MTLIPLGFRASRHRQELLELLDRMNPTVDELNAAVEDPAAASGFKAKMQTEEAQQIYAPRSRIAEFAHAWIKERCGLRQFRKRSAPRSR